ncbi:MAG: TetR/AcrR family transcriptional regulator C-terminal domain-containing protein [Propionibacteriaceae bacterium]|nr:TetR/AcrR family transcriptional regulator C-terminal domain-containing protein [Propionibacteriaceae bacterium]
MGEPRQRLNRERVLLAAVALADAEGVDAVSMRRLAAELGVVPMALYKHVAGKDELLDGMVDVVLAGVAGELAERGGDDAGARREDGIRTRSGVAWRDPVRGRILATRRVQLRHPWLRRVLETRTTRTPVVLAYTDALIGSFRAAGFSDPLTHHVMHALGSRIWGFTQDLFEDADQPAPDPASVELLAQHFPNVAAVAGVAVHDDGTVVAQGCDDQFEFEFALDLLLDGIARLHEQGWLPPARDGGVSAAGPAGRAR